MEHKNILRGIFVILFITAAIGVLAFAGYFINRALTVQAPNCDQLSPIIVLNKTDQEVEVTVRGKGERTQTTYIPMSARGCFELLKPDIRLDYLVVSYNKRKYKFSDRQQLNSFPAPHYFALLVLEKTNDPNRAIVQQKITTTLKDRFRYLVLSAYAKLGAPLGEDAKVQIQRLR